MDSTGQKRDIQAAAESNIIESFGNLLELDEPTEAPATKETFATTSGASSSIGSGLDELMSLGTPQPPSSDPLADLMGGPAIPNPDSLGINTAPVASSVDPLADLLGGGAAMPSTTMPPDYCRIPDRQVVNPTDTGKNGKSGVTIKASFQRNPSDQVIIHLNISNGTGEELNDMAMKFKPNSFGLSPDFSGLQGVSIVPGMK